MSETTPVRRNRFRRSRNTRLNEGDDNSHHSNDNNSINRNDNTGSNSSINNDNIVSTESQIDDQPDVPQTRDELTSTPDRNVTDNNTPSHTVKSAKSNRGLFGRRRRFNSEEEDDGVNNEADETDQLVPKDGSRSEGEDNRGSNRSGINRFRKGRKGKSKSNLDVDDSNAVNPNDDEERPGVKYGNEPSCCTCVKFNLMFSMGYNMEELERHRKIKDTRPDLYLERDTFALGVGVTVHSMDSLCDKLDWIVKPMVKVHAVSISTGYYIKSKKLPVMIPAVTRPCSLQHITHRAVWNQEMVLDAYFSDIAKEDTLLLFEILDDKPSLSSVMNRKNHKAPIAKRVAWAYLLPIGTTGNLNIGFSDAWKAENRFKDSNIRLPKDDSISAQEINRSDQPSHDLDAPEAVSNLQAEANNSATEEDGIVNGGVESENSLQNAGDDNNSITSSNPIKRERQKYPWDEPSADKKLRLQLHYYRKYDGLFGFLQRQYMGWPTLGAFKDNGESCYPNGIPEVYVQWRLQQHYPIRGCYLRVSLGPRPIEMIPSVLNTTLGAEHALALNKESFALSDEMRAAAIKSKQGRRGHVWGAIPPKSQSELNRLRSAVIKRTRGNRERCVVPEKLLYRYDAGSEGAMVVAFSTSGHILAVAAKANATSVPLSNEDTIYSLRLFDTDMNEEVWVEDAAHHAVIYEIKWTKNDRYLLTCSGDGTCKVWDMITLAARSSNQVGFTTNGFAPVTDGHEQPPPGAGSISPRQYGRLSQNLRTLLSKPPYLVCTLAASPPVYTYCATFTDMTTPPSGKASSGGYNSLDFTAAAEMSASEHLEAIENAPVPRIITGAADGRLRVWDNGQLLGFIHVSRKDSNSAMSTDGYDYSPHDGAINSLLIDERSKYLISADSVGDILAWRLDTKGWYQLLRKFKRDALPTPGAEQINPNIPYLMGPGGIMSLSMHPEKHKGQMLALSRQPAQLRLINMNTYKTQCFCEGFVGVNATNAAGGNFFRASMSADGRFVVCGSSIKAERGKYRLQLWDSQTGHVVRTPLSDCIFPYPVRSVSWHPAQHMLAVAMVGPGAAVVVYSGERESLVPEDDADFILHSPRGDAGSLTALSPRPPPHTAINTTVSTTVNTTSPPRVTAASAIASNSSLTPEEQAEKQDRAKELLAKIRASRAAKNESK